MKKRIIFITEGRIIGGAETNLLTYLEYLDKTRFRPLVILSHHGKLKIHLEHLDIDTEIIKAPPLLSTGFEFSGFRIPNPLFIIYDLLVILIKTAKLVNFFSKIDTSIIHTNGMFEHIYGGLAAKIAGFPCIWHVQSIPSKIGQPFLNLLAKFIPTRIVAISKKVQEIFKGSVREKVLLIYYGLDMNRFNLRAQKRSEETKKALGFKDSELIIGMVGRVVPWKGHMDFIKAAKIINERIPNSKFLIVGDTALGKKGYLDKLKRLAKTLHIEERITFTGFVDNVEELLSIVDVFVHCSIRPEPFGLNIIEAMASYKAVVATDIGAPREIIDDDLNGKLVKPDGPLSLSKAIINLLELPDKRTKLGNAARKKVEERFNIERYVVQLSSLYNAINGGDRSRYRA